MKPLFILSLPRSGSTLLQRLLAAHPAVATVSEPWFLLPMLYPLREVGVHAEYSHADVHRALSDLCNNLPGGQDDYLGAVREAACRIYHGLGEPEAAYFVDKTPRYHLVLEEIFRAFPDGKFIFLFRNPLAVVASIANTWAGGKWCLYRARIDLYRGLENLVKASRRYADRSLLVNYEKLVEDPQRELDRIARYTGLAPDSLGTVPADPLPGTFGDRRGGKADAEIDPGSLHKWRQTLANPFRKSWTRRYLRWIGGHRLSAMGYELEGLTRDLQGTATSSRHLGSDLVRAAYGYAYCALDFPFMHKKLKLLLRPKQTTYHN